MRRVDGIPIDRIDALDQAKIDRKALSQRAARFILECILLHGFFHADPHPGNFAVQPDGRLVVYDFGMVGRLDQRQRYDLLDALLALLRNDFDALIDALGRLGVVRHETDRPALRRELQHLVDRYYGLPLGEYRIQEVTDDVFRLIRRFRLTLPPELTLLAKTLSMHEGIGKQLDPSFQPFVVAGPYVRQLLMRRYSPYNWVPELLRFMEETTRQIPEWPRRLDRLVRRLEQAELEITMHLAELPEVTRRLTSLINRLVLAILLAAAAISLSLLLNVWHPSWLLQLVGPALHWPSTSYRGQSHSRLATLARGLTHKLSPSQKRRSQEAVLFRHFPLPDDPKPDQDPPHAQDHGEPGQEWDLVARQPQLPSHASTARARVDLPCREYPGKTLPLPEMLPLPSGRSTTRAHQRPREFALLPAVQQHGRGDARPLSSHKKDKGRDHRRLRPSETTV